ncbi:MAG: sialidase family protein [Candidatus Hydrogenedentes bacterium]|nr:sialidase family protein [Candidatus Hydrogenedentota bacterium]
MNAESVIKARGLVTTDAPAGYPSRAFPGICLLPDGRWLCGFRGAATKDATDKQDVYLTWSDDEGTSWSTPVAPFEASALRSVDELRKTGTVPSEACDSVPRRDCPQVFRDLRAGRFRAIQCTALGDSRVLATLYWVDASSPDLPFFNEETEGLLDSRIFHSVSEDDGTSWSPPALMDTAPYHQPTPITGPTLVLPDGRWACQFELNKAYTDPKPWRHASVLMFSEDQGETWIESVEVRPDPDNQIFYWDQRPSLLPDGSLLDVFWTYDRKRGVYLNIHASRSVDGGRTWSPPWDTGIPGQPAPVVAVDDATLVMVYMDRTSHPLLKVRLSRDGGRTWPEESECILDAFDALTNRVGHATMQDAWAEMGAFAAGLPATAQTRDGDPLVVYYAGPDTNRTDIYRLRLASAALLDV